MKPVPFVVASKKPDALVPLEPSQVSLTGWLGARVKANAENRLPQVDLEPLLAGYRQRPGSHPWIGEHLGKWLHAATLAWQYTGNATLKGKIDGAVRALLACQESDGYLGTYEKNRRFGLFPGADWDVWSHKYNLIGLLAYYGYTGDKAALEGCKKIGVLLCVTFGPGKKSLLSAGTHVGMAATSILEPMVLLYRHTGDRKFLDFCHYLVRAWDEPGGPKILSTLTQAGKVHKTANGKAYEMLSNLVGLCELYRTTGDLRFLVPCTRAFDDIVENQLYVTGTMSYGEHFHANHALPNAPAYNVGETCVTVTWLQLCWQLLRLTGEGRYAAQIERSLYNHLAAAQRPDGREWCYYTALEGTKPYGPGISCCVSSGPRGMALAPQMACYLSTDGTRLFVASHDSFTARLTVQGVPVTLTQKSSLPVSGQLVTHWDAPRPIRLRVSRDPSPPSRPQSGPGALGATLTDSVPLERVELPGMHTNAGKSVAMRGPFVLAEQGGREVLFADAGASGEKYRVWIGPPPESAESQIRPGNVIGSINDGDVRTFTVSWDGQSHADEDWYALTLLKPKRVGKLSFAHGHSFPDGGWFVGAPRFEVKATPESPWESVGALPGYPETSDTDPKGLRDGQWFTLVMPAPREIVALRIIGKPACGNNPNLRFTSCAELKAE